MWKLHYNFFFIGNFLFYFIWRCSKWMIIIILPSMPPALSITSHNDTKILSFVHHSIIAQIIELSNSCFHYHKDTVFSPGQPWAKHNKYSFPLSTQLSTCLCKGSDIPYKVLDWHLESILLYNVHTFLQQYYVDSSF